MDSQLYLWVFGDFEQKKNYCLQIEVSQFK